MIPFVLILLVLSEMVGSTDGLGYLVTSAGQTFEYRLMWAGIAVVIVGQRIPHPRSPSTRFRTSSGIAVRASDSVIAVRDFPRRRARSSWV